MAHALLMFVEWEQGQNNIIAASTLSCLAYYITMVLTRTPSYTVIVLDSEQWVKDTAFFLSLSLSHTHTHTRYSLADHIHNHVFRARSEGSAEYNYN